MQSGTEERLVDVDVPEAGNQRLIEKHALQLAGTPGERGGERFGGKRGREWLRSEPAIERRDVVRQQVQDAAELALVGEAKVLPAIELDRQVLEAQPGVV